MLTIQEAGTEILGDSPKNLYIFGGIEYGIKVKYLEHLKQYYKESQEMTTVSDTLAIFSRKQLIPLSPKLYIVRYDDTFISDLSEKFIKKLLDINIKGTIVCIYEEEKAVRKCNKYLPDNTVSFDSINPSFIKQYLSKDFPELSTKAIEEAVRIHPDYMGAYNICLSLNTLSEMDIDGLNQRIMNAVFGYDVSSSENQFRQAFAERNFHICSDLIDTYIGDLSQIFYVWLATMLDMEKLLINSKQRSDISKSVKRWSMESVYNMFMQIYHQLELSRNSTVSNISDGLMYLALLLQYETIPAVEVM